jgi:hypothetical protein
VLIPGLRELVEMSPATHVALRAEVASSRPRRQGGRSPQQVSHGCISPRLKRARGWAQGGITLIPKRGESGANLLTLATGWSIYCFCYCFRSAFSVEIHA